MKLGYILLYVDDVEKTMAFYETAFHLKRGFLTDEKDYGEMVTGDTKLGFVLHTLVETHGFKYDRMSLDKRPPSNEIGFVTPDVSAAFQHAVKCGAMELSKPSKKPWGQTVSLVRDINGFIVEISSPIGE